MDVSKEKTERIIDEYKVYVDKIIGHTYYWVKNETKDELRQTGLIGLWKGITAYYKREPNEFVQKEFIDTICAYIRYEMSNSLNTLSLVKIGGKQRRNFLEVQKIVNANPYASEEELKNLASALKLRYDWYIKTKKYMNNSSLDAAVNEENDTAIHNFIACHEPGIKAYIDKTYIDYIIASAMAGIKKERDKNLIQSWLDSIYSAEELERTELAKLYGLSSSMVGVIIKRFIGICKFVGECEKKFCIDPNGSVYFPEIKEKNRTYNGKKIPGIKWILRNRKWKVEITAGKNKSIFIGLFDNYNDAVTARRNAEIQYRGKSDIELHEQGM